MSLSTVRTYVLQVSQLSHEMLAQLNENGFVTDSSQDASNKDSNYMEYSYVRGFICSSQLYKRYSNENYHVIVHIVVSENELNQSYVVRIPVTIESKYDRQIIHTSVPDIIDEWYIIRS